MRLRLVVQNYTRAGLSLVLDFGLRCVQIFTKTVIAFVNFHGT